MRALALVNGNARRASPRTCDRLAKAVPGRVAITRSLDEARTILRAEVRRGVDLVVFGGGDGTAVMGLALLAEACRGAGRGEPAVGMLRLGTGNALARTLGATDDPVDDLVRLARGAGHWRSTRMIDVLGIRAPFVGTGLDAQVLEDQAAVNRIVDRVPLARRLLGGTARYTLSVALRSIPRLAAGGRAIATVTNVGSPATAMSPAGPIGTRATGAVLWQGPYTMLAAATIPYFGFGIRMFAFAEQRADRFQLRCADPSLFEVLRVTPAAFRGEYFGDSVQDFLCDRVRIDISDGDAAIEAGGELVGRQPSFELGLSAPLTVAAIATTADPR